MRGRLTARAVRKNPNFDNLGLIIVGSPSVPEGLAR
jgi:hypothetical protein